jgi:hypothetical protein
VRRERSARPAARGGVAVRRLHETVDDGYRSPLVPGLKSSQDATRLAEEVAFAATRLTLLASDPPGLYAEVADPAGDLEERSWLAFLIAYLYPLQESDPFAAIRAVRTSWQDAGQLALEDVQTGPRSPYDPDRGVATVNAYRAWAERGGSQAAAFVGDLGWSPERRFARTFERLSLPGLDRDARFELLLSLGVLGVYELRPASLALGGDEEVTLGAKRAFAIGDPMLLERRAAQLAEACSSPLGALDLALYNWQRGERVTAGLGAAAAPGEPELDAALTALEL